MPPLRRPLVALALATLVACESDPTAPTQLGPLTSGTTVVISGGSFSERIFTIEVPEGTGTLRFLMTGGEGDADLIVRHGARPQTGFYDCVSENIFSEEECIFDLPSAGTWYVLVYGYNSYSSVSLTGTLLSQSGSTPLTSGVAVTELAGGAGSFRMFSIPVPAGADSMRVNLTATGDVDLYIRPSSFPLLNNYYDASFTDTGTETIKATSPPSGTWYIRVDGFDVFTGGTLTATVYSPPPPP
jgi:serine protease